MVMENLDNIKNSDFDIPSDVLDEIQKNIKTFYYILNIFLNFI